MIVQEGLNYAKHGPSRIRQVVSRDYAHLNGRFSLQSGRNGGNAHPAALGTEESVRDWVSPPESGRKN